MRPRTTTPLIFAMLLMLALGCAPASPDAPATPKDATGPTSAQAESAAETETEAEAARPNIVLIVADDLDVAFAGFMRGDGGASATPTLDRLAREGGLVLEQMHSPSPICTPSRFAILSGRYPSRSTEPGFLHETEEAQGQTVVRFNTHLNPGEPALPHWLRDAGYYTGAVGKNHVYEVAGHRRLPYSSALDGPGVQDRLAENAEHLHAAYRAAGFDYAQALYWGNPDADGIRPLAAHNQDWVSAAAEGFLNARDADKPFFLYMATTLPHGPFEPERSWRASPLITPHGLLDNAPPPITDRTTLPGRLDAWDVRHWNRENVLWLDEAVRVLIEQLEARGELDNTVLVFLSDHGTQAKGSVYDRGTHTVALVWRQGGFAADDALPQRASLVDIAPTLLALAGTSIEAQAPDVPHDGVDLTPWLGGERTDAAHESMYFEVGYTRAVTVGDWKYVAVRYPPNIRDMPQAERERRLNDNIASLEARGRPIPTRDPMTPFSHLSAVPGGEDAEQVSIRKFPAYFEPDQLYNLADDPQEQRNLANDPAHADKLAQLQAVLRQYVDDLPGTFDE